MARFLIAVRLHDTRVGRLKALVPTLLALLGRLSKAVPEQAFRSMGADLIAYCITSDMAAQQIAAAIESPGRAWTADVSPVLDGEDELMVLEIGDKFAVGKGFTRIGTWLQHNH